MALVGMVFLILKLQLTGEGLVQGFHLRDFAALIPLFYGHINTTLCLSWNLRNVGQEAAFPEGNSSVF